MPRAFFTYTLLCLFVCCNGQSQNVNASFVSTYTYHPPSNDKEPWQRLNLWLSSIYIFVSKEGQGDQDSCLYAASRSLGLSRYSILAEGFGDAELQAQSKWIDNGDPATGINLLTKATGKKRLQWLLLLGAYYAFQPHNIKHSYSVEYFLNRAVSESKTLEEARWGRIARCLLGKIYLQANNAKGDSIYNLLVDECRKAGDKETEARALAYRGIYTAPLQTTFKIKIDGLQRASELYHNIGDVEGEANMLYNLGFMQVVSGQLQVAYELFLQAQSLAERVKYPYTHYISDALAMATFFQGKFGEPFRHALQTIKTAESCRDSLSWGYFYSRLSGFYYSEGRKKEGLEMAQKAVSRFVSTHNASVYPVLGVIIYNLHQQGRETEALQLAIDISKKVVAPGTPSDLFAYHNAFASCYMYLNKLDTAEMHVQKMDSLETEAEKIRGPFNRSLVTDMYGNIFFTRRQFKKAREYFEKQFTTTSYGQRAMDYDLITYRSLITCDSALGDNAEAVAHYNRYTRLLDSNFKVTQIRQAEELAVIYETQEKEGQIAALNQQAKQTRLVRDLTFWGIGAAIIIALLLYRQSRLRRKNNTIVTHKNEQLQALLADKEWLLKEVHHRVKNNLQVVISLLNSQSVYIDNDAALTAINDSQRRVHAISLIHQKLYQSENTSSIDMVQYIDELVGFLQDSFDIGNRIFF